MGYQVLTHQLYSKLNIELIIHDKVINQFILMEHSLNKMLYLHKEGQLKVKNQRYQMLQFLEETLIKFYLLYFIYRSFNIIPI